MASLAQLIVFVRGIFYCEVFEALLFCKPLTTSAKGEDIFKMIDIYFFSGDNLQWEICVSVCIDGVKAMSGHIAGLVGHQDCCQL